MKVFLFLIIVFSSLFQILREPITDLERSKLKGKVKSLTETEYETNPVSKVPQKGKMLAKFTSQFNENGNVSETHIFNADGSIRFMHFFTFDKSGNQTESRLYNPDMSLGGRVEYTFDEKGRKIRESIYDYYKKLVAKHIYNYDKSQVISRESYGEEGNLTGTGFILIDANGNETEETWYTEKGTPDVKWTRSYDSLNRPVQTNQYSLKDHLDDIEYFKYDSDSYETEDKMVDGRGALIRKTNTIYLEKDQTGNWIRKVTYKFEKPVSITERIIIYY
jgi:hypothetical protein